MIFRSLALLVAVGLATPVSANEAVQPIILPNETLVLVEAKGESLVTPDSLTMNVGVVTTGTSAVAALEQNNERMARVLLALKQSGVDAKSIQTIGFDVEPQYDDPDSRTTIIGYEVANEVKITFSELNRAGMIITSLFDAGANIVSTPRFDVAAEKQVLAENEARTAALIEAQRQVDSLSGPLGLRVSRVLRISNVEIDFDGDYGPPADMVTLTGSRIIETPIEAGEMTVEATIFVEYALVRK